MPADDFDVVVLGGGPAGCATALALARHGSARVLVVEAGRYTTVRIGESVPPDIRVVLQQLGICDDFLNEAHEPCLGSCASWGADALGYNDFLFNPLGNGWHLDRRRFDAFLARQAVRRGTVLATATRFDDCARVGTEGFRLRLRRAEGAAYSVTTRYVVDATGARSCFARRLGARRLLLDQLICVTGFLTRCGAPAFTRLTMLEAVEYGWWYAARLPDARLAVAVASDADVIKQQALRRPDGWRAALAATRHIAPAVAGWRLVAASQVACAAPSFLLDQVAGEGWLAVGDAASAYDPISSQGIHKALSDGLRAGAAIAACLRRREAGFGAYQSAVAARFRQFAASRGYFYGLEQRWPQSPFWTRRRARTTPEPDTPAHDMPAQTAIRTHAL